MRRPSFHVPTYLVAPLPFRRRRSSTSTATSNSPSSSSSATPSTSPLFPTTSINGKPTKQPSYLNGHTSYLRCAHCSTHLCYTSQIISKSFTGQHGRAYLVAGKPDATVLKLSRHDTTAMANTRTDEPRPRQLVTGMHQVADLECRTCGNVLGWQYVAAEEESEQYKVGKFILETKCVVKSVCWEEQGEDHTVSVEDVGFGGLSKGMRGLGSLEEGVGERAGNGPGEVEFDSEDEVECEALFEGVWNPRKAGVRRRRKLRTMSSEY